MGLFGGQSTIKRSAGTRPNTPVFGGENTGFGDDGEEGYDQEDQDDNYEEDDGSGSQPDVTVVPQKESQVPFGNIKFSSQGKFTVHAFAFVYTSMSLKLQLCLGNPILHHPSPQSFLASDKALKPHSLPRLPWAPPLDLIFLENGHLRRVTRRLVQSLN